MIKKYLMIIVPLLLLNTCGENATKTSGAGSISFNVDWVGAPGSISPAAGIYRAPLDCTAAGIATVEAAVFFTNPQQTFNNSNIVGSGGPWDCAAHSGDISVFAPQNGVTVGIMGKNAGGGIVYYGEQTNVSVNQDQTTDIGTITASYVIPEGVTAVAGSGRNLVSWNTVTSAATYNIYWSTATGVTPASGTKIDNVTSPYTHTGIANGTTYYYIVTASRANVESAGSSQVSALPIAGATMPVTAAATSITDTGATLNGSFDNPPGFSTSASFEYGTTTAYGASTPPSTFAATGPVNSVTAALTPLFQNTTYHYRLKTSNTGGTFNGADQTFSTMRTVSTLASASTGPRGIAVDATNVYWTDTQFAFTPPSSGSIKSVKSDGTVTTITTIATGASFTTPFSIVVDANNVYWTNTAGGTINKAVKTSGAPTAIATSLSSPQFIAVDATSVYWTESGTGPGTGTVSKVLIGGGAVTILAPGLNSPMGIAVDGTSVYWTETVGGTVKKVAIAGGQPTILAQGLTNPYGIAVDATNVYWTENITGWTGTTGNIFVGGGLPSGSSVFGNIKKIGINGGVVTTLATNQNNPHGIAVDSGNVYWTSYPGFSGNSISKISINGGTVTIIARSENYPLFLAVDSTSVYWTGYQSGIRKADK